MQLEQDVHYALRKLRRSPGFALTAILTLALGVGATTAVFSVIDAVLLRPLPFSDPHSIVVPESRSRSGYTQPASVPSYRDESAQQHMFTALAAYSTSGVNFESPHGPVALHATKGSDTFFDVFGVRPILGRTFLPGEDQPGRDDMPGAEVAHLARDQTMVFPVIAAVLFLIGLLAAMLPARRAATIDPITALRTE